MIKLELETMLEAGLYALGTPLRDRLYAEDIRIGADIDDQYCGSTVDEAKKDIDKTPVDGERIRNILSSLTRIQQKLVIDSKLPFFIREAEGCNSLRIEYDTYTSEQLECYRSEADRLIQEGKVDYEVLSILPMDGDCGPLLAEVLVINYDNKSGPKVKTYVNSEAIFKHRFNIKEDASDGLRQKLDNSIKALSQLNGERYNSTSVYQRIINFLNCFG